MYAVVFRAELKPLDETYAATAVRMRQLAKDCGCVDFQSITQGSHEISVSYWASLEQIRRWKQHPEHLEAQRLGQERWYRSYRVEVVDVLREYGGEEA